jgi:ABC-2 type transport system ATP-binding protein
MSLPCPVDIVELTKTFRDRKRRQILALDNLSLQVSEGEIFGFLGPNGAGKSTTIKTLVGMIRPTSGVARLFGQHSGAPAARRRIGYLPENPAFYDVLTAREYLALVGRSCGMNGEAIMRESDRVLDLLDLREAERRPIRGYSKGMVQRLGLAQALLHDPDLYIFDEPMSGLDPIGRALVKQVMVDLKLQGKTIFFSTHVTADVEAVCDRVAVLVKGRLMALDSVQNVLARGVEGYAVRFTGPGRFDGYDAETLPGELRQIMVQPGQLSSLLAAITAEGGTVQHLEARRRDLERFFLDIVQQSN